jgi:hypothetical protein
MRGVSQGLPKSREKGELRDFWAEVLNRENEREWARMLPKISQKRAKTR